MKFTSILAAVGLASSVQAFDHAKYPMKDLERFGMERGQFWFRWPTEKDLDDLGLTEPPKLKEIRTKGGEFNSAWSMSGFQMIYEGGIESVIMDASPCNPETEECYLSKDWHTHWEKDTGQARWDTLDVSGSDIRTIEARVNPVIPYSHINRLTFKDANDWTIRSSRLY